jgi:hypothetical protein
MVDLLPAAWDRALTRLERPDYSRDPVAWARDMLGEHVWSKQAEVMRAVQDNRLVTVQSAHGVGKSHLASRLAAWFLDVNPLDKTMVITTAPTAHQVSAVLWRYIRQAHEKAGLRGYITQGQVPEWKVDGNIVAFGRRPADHQQSAFQGFHADHMLIILDEAGGIPKWLWDAADSMMTGDGNQHLLAIGNPDDNSSHFQRVCTREPNWTRFRISAFDAPAYTNEPLPPEHEGLRSTLVNQVYVDDKRDRWGEQSPLYRVKVLGEFVDAEDGLIPLSWVRAANQRWHAWSDAGAREVGGRRIIAVDVARYGEDATVLALREGDVIRELQVHHKLDTTQTTSLVEAQLDFPASRAVVDVIGVGAGVVDQLRARRRPVEAFNASAGTKRRDVTGSWRFPNTRSAAWWNLRELLDPSRGATLALPEDDDLTAELTAPKWRIGVGNTLVVEPKDDMKKRLGRSPDRADAVVMACWTNPTTALDRSGEGERRRPRGVQYVGAQF